ncbi:MAG TPA: hypothetical protein VG327_02470 [Mycobacterium sp.]|jgi:hypothetical protein|nr:hypothetical protein [Mycobacterium sp.]
MTTQPINGLFPVLIQSRFGAQGNFELVTTHHDAGDAGGALAHFWRNNDDPPTYPWSLPTVFGTNVGPPALISPTMIESNFGTPGTLEVICLGAAQVPAKEFFYFWRESGPTFKWDGPESLPITPPQGVTGNPVLIQSRFGDKGNFELVCPAFGGGLAHMWRDNDDPGYPWSEPTVFGSDLDGIEGVTMIQSNFGSPGNLEVICSAATVNGSPNRLYYFRRDSGPTFTWNGPYFLPITPPGGVVGPPALIQSRFGKQGNFELVTPVKNGGLAHYWRDNDDPNRPWNGPTLFGGGLGVVSWVTLIQSNFGDPGNLEVICETGPGQIYHFWRDSGPTFTWNGPDPLVSTI